MKIRFVSWDWKEQIYIQSLNEALANVFNGKNLPSITEIDSGGDNFEIVVCSDPLTKDQAQAVWEACLDLGDEKHPSDTVVEIDLQEALKNAAARRQKGDAEKRRREQLGRKGLQKLSREEREALHLPE